MEGSWAAGGCHPGRPRALGVIGRRFCEPVPEGRDVYHRLPRMPTEQTATDRDPPPNPVSGLESPYAPAMNPAKMHELLAPKPEEISDGLWFVDVCERWGSMDQAEADEWRRRIDARQRFLELGDDAVN
jgi:hypothetical protein